MLNPSSKTFSIRKLQGLCKSNPAAQGISFIPPAPVRNPASMVRASPINSSPSSSFAFAKGGPAINSGRGSSANGWSGGVGGLGMIGK